MRRLKTLIAYITESGTLSMGCSIFRDSSFEGLWGGPKLERLPVTKQLKLLDDRWDEGTASKLEDAELLRYRSNLLGSDLRITNYGGGNTSSKLSILDSLDSTPRTTLWVKGSGGDLGSIGRDGFATLYLDRLLALEAVYAGADREDEMVEFYPQCRFGNNPVAASIDTPLHAFLPFPHVDHLHPDWGIALAASANGREKMDEFNLEFGHRLSWLPWRRPGFELAMMLKEAVAQAPECNGIVLGGHGLFTWGATQRECYQNTITVIDELGQFIERHDLRRAKAPFGGQKYRLASDREMIVCEILPLLRGALGRNQLSICSYVDCDDVVEFVNSVQGKRLAYLGTSCPDHFIRTKIRPMYVDWDPDSGSGRLPQLVEDALEIYRAEYRDYYLKHASSKSPAQRDASPTVVLIPGLGMFALGKNKVESRLTGEFYTNAIHVMKGAGSLAGDTDVKSVPQASRFVDAGQFTIFENYVALPPSEAFGIEYWALEEAKIRRQPPEKELTRRIALIVGAGSGIGRETALLAAERGAAVVVADRDLNAAEAVACQCQKIVGKEMARAVFIDIRNREEINSALQKTLKQFGGLDILVNTAAIFPSAPEDKIADAMWNTTLEINVTGNYLLVDEARKIFKSQRNGGSIVLTSSANAVVAKKGSEAYDVSKAALSHLIRELAVTMAPVRVNGISPATVVKGSTMFPRDRVKASLSKYDIQFGDSETDESLRTKLAQFYADRTLTHVPIDPKHCAEAILFLAGPKTPVTTGHLIPVDGGLVEAYLR